MIISQTGEYALRAMARLAQEARGGEVLNSESLAQQTKIPTHYVSKVMRQLVLAGLVEARRGHGGGFRLARDPADVSFHDILAAVGEDRTDPPCVFGFDRCDASAPCPLHGSWSRLKASYVEWARTTTLAEVAPTESD